MIKPTFIRGASPFSSRMELLFCLTAILLPLSSIAAAVTGWGGNHVGQSASCASDVVAIAAGYEHNVLLKSDGTVAACGAYPFTDSIGHFSEIPVFIPPGLTSIIAVSAGDTHSLALRADGTVVAWGIGAQGQTNVPAGLSNVVAISAGARHNLALKANGTVVGWGNGSWVDGLTNVVAISAGRGNSLVLTGEGKVLAWGLAGSTPSPATLNNIVAISAGDNGLPFGYTSWIALQADGTVFAGSPHGYSLGPILSNVVAIAASRGTDHHISLALRSNGTVTALPWGFNFYGFPPDNQPLVPPALTGVIAIAAGDTHNLALVGGSPPISNEVLHDPSWASEGFSVSTPTTYGRVYRLEYKDNLTDEKWTGLPLVAGNGGMQTFSDSQVNPTKRFYRVQRW